MRASARLPLAVRSAAFAARRGRATWLAPEWNRYYTTMHPDDAAEWEADICSAEAALFACEAGGGPCGGGPPDKQAREKKLYTGLIRASRKSQSSWAAGHKGQGTEEGLL